MLSDGLLSLFASAQENPNQLFKNRFPAPTTYYILLLILLLAGLSLLEGQLEQVCPEVLVIM